MAWICCCILATLSTMAWQLSNYYNGEEQQIVEYRTFNDMDTDRYPSLALCWTMTINEKKLKIYGDKFTSKGYKNFLTGLVWDENMLKVKYDEVTANLTDYILQYGYWKSSGKRKILYDIAAENKLKPGLREWSFFSQKCITFDIPFKKRMQISSFYVFLKSSIFGKGGRLANPDTRIFNENQFHLTLHYQNQFIRRFKVSKKHWPIRAQGSSKHYVMRLTVESIDVLVRRNTYHTPCIEGAPEHDQTIINYVLEGERCKPPYFNLTSTLEPCSQQKQLRQIYMKIKMAVHNGNAKRFLTAENPCRSLERISYDAIDVESRQTWMQENPWLNESTGVVLDFKELTYKEVKSVRGMDIQALIGKFTIQIIIK